MNFFRKIRILKRIYNAGYVDDKISEEALTDRITADMLKEENNNEKKIKQLKGSNARLKDKIASKNKNKNKNNNPPDSDGDADRNKKS